jgi:hypothetical protein
MTGWRSSPDPMDALPMGRMVPGRVDPEEERPPPSFRRPQAGQFPSEPAVTRRDLDIDTLRLGIGCHLPGDRMCVMEAAAYIAGESWTDDPACVSPVIAQFLRTWNDSLGTDDRQQLRQWIVPVIGTASTPDVELARSYLASDWLARTYTVAWFRKAGWPDLADKLAALPELTTPAAWLSAGPIVREVVITTRGIAPCAAQDAVGWEATRGVAGVVARAAAGDAARDAAQVAVGAAASGAVWTAARGAAHAVTWETVGGAARAAFADTVSELQASAHDLMARMIAVGQSSKEES